MKFSEMPYNRPDLEVLKSEVRAHHGDGDAPRL